MRQRRYGSRLDESETETEYRIDHLGVLVKARSQTERIAEREVPHASGQNRIVGLGAATGQAVFERPDRRMVRRLGIEQKQQRPRKTVDQISPSPTLPRVTRKGTSKNPVSVIPAKAGIQKKLNDWMPDQVRHDDFLETLSR